MRLAVTGKRGQIVSALGDPRDAQSNDKIAPVYGFSLPEWTQSLPVCVERWLDAAKFGELKCAALFWRAAAARACTR